MSQKKQIFKLNTLNKLLTGENSCVSLVQGTRLLALPPFFLNDMKSGILYQLNSMLKKYDRSLGGIVIGYQNIKVLMDENTGIIPIGTSETEVNISVEFYIFQPKIGSCLEGVINKKSNTHIGCLVHQYFNATILKPEDIPYEDWICKDLKVDDKIIFKVKDLDFTTLLPYIEGIYEEGVQLDKVNSKKSRNCDIDNVMVKDVINRHQTDVAFLNEVTSRKISNNDSDDDFLDDIKENNDNTEQDTHRKYVDSILGQDKFSTDKKEKKKKRKNKSILENDLMKTKEDQNEQEKTSDQVDKVLQIDESPNEKKKRKKKKKNKNEEEEGSIESPAKIEKNEMVTNLPCNLHEKFLQIEDENSNDFVKIEKNKKEKKKRKNLDEELLPNCNKTSECLLPQETDDNVLYSTQLEPLVGSKKMRISFCSPIPKGAPFESKTDIDSAVPDISVHVNHHESPDGTDKDIKKKEKKRKREKKGESDDSPSAKKIKISPNASKEDEKTLKVNGSQGKSLVQNMMEELFKQQLNRVKEELNMSSSDKESFKEEKKRKESKKEKRESKIKENEKSQINGGGKDTEMQSILEKLCRQELQRVKEELSMSEKESFKESKKTKVKKIEKETPKEKTKNESAKAKELTNAQINSTNDEKKSEEETCKVIDKNKEESGKTNHIQEKKKKSESQKEDTIQISLYDKLLKQAKNSIGTAKDHPSSPAKELKRIKKDSEVSSASISDSKKKDSRKKNKHNKQKTEDCPERSDQLKNGSMYDFADTPEKINPDKSLFSDSEQSHSSPVKKTKEVNGDSGKSQVQNLLDEFYKEEMKRLKSESDKESLKSAEKKKKSKSKQKSENEKQESLYEKLLKEAKSLIEVGENSSSTSGKKEKKSETKKKQKMVQDCLKT